MIQQIGFKNFRRFEEFPMMNLGDINIFVGRNNAGKSTVLKAIQLLKGNLNTLSKISKCHNIMMTPMFVFDVEELNELHIDNFERALYNKAERKEITLSANVNGCQFTIVLDGQNIKKDDYYVAIPYNFIELENEDIHLTFNFQTRDVNFELKSSSSTRKDDLQSESDAIKKQLTEIKSSLAIIKKKFQDSDAFSYSASEMAELVSTQKELERKKKGLQNQLKEYEIGSKSEALVVSIKNISDFLDNENVNIISQIFNNISRYAGLPVTGKKNTSEYKNSVATQEKIKSIENELGAAKNSFIDALSKFELEYIHAHAASQKVIYLKEDRNDALSRALNQFCKAKILPGSKEWTFVKRWMNSEHFAIGEDFTINSIESAGYTLRIIDNGEEMNLADKGTGTIQLMTLLLSLAVIMHEYSGSFFVPIVLIEEPEQNIHPMLQSLLADMFVDFRKQFENSNPQLIVETHSEYLIRRTQVIVARENYENEDILKNHNPFKVFYFNKDNKDIPFYEMEYAITGGFKQTFMPGFFDEASKLDMEIIRKEHERGSNTVEDLNSLLSLIK